MARDLDAQPLLSEQGFIGIDAPHICPLPTLYVIRRWKNPPVWSIWKCPECREEWHYGYSYAHDDEPGWNRGRRALRPWEVDAK